MSSPQNPQQYPPQQPGQQYPPQQPGQQGWGGPPNQPIPGAAGPPAYGPPPGQYQQGGSYQQGQTQPGQQPQGPYAPGQQQFPQQPGGYPGQVQPKKRKVWPIVLICVGAALILAVGGGIFAVVHYIANDSAPGTAKTYITAINDGDCAKARSVVVPALREQIDDSCGSDTAKNGKYTIGQIQYTSHGSQATVIAHLSRSDGDLVVTIDEVKQGGSWLIQKLESS